MEPQLGLVVVLLLLGGPTALWVIYRLVGAGRSSRGEFEHGPAPLPGEASLATELAGASSLQNGFWICDSCRSLNRSAARRCYSCRATRDAAAEAPSAEPVAAPMVPVMAEDAARPLVGIPIATAVPVAATRGTAGPALATSAREPESAGDTAPPGPAPSPLAPAAPRARVRTVARPRVAAPPPVAAVPFAAAVSPTPSEPAATSVAAPRPEPTQVAARGVILPARTSEPAGAFDACPFLGVDGDPSTRFDFPHPGNVCHALAARPSGGALRRLGLRGNGREQPVDLGYQGSTCLTPSYAQCDRYLRADPATAARLGSRHLAAIVAAIPTVDPADVGAHAVPPRAGDAGKEPAEEPSTPGHRTRRRSRAG